MSKTTLDETTTQHLKSWLSTARWRNYEIDRLVRFLNAHPPTSDDTAELDIKHLEFARYLVRTGRIEG